MPKNDEERFPEPRRVEKVEVEKGEESNPRVGNRLANEEHQPDADDLDTSKKGSHPFQSDAEPYLVTSTGHGREGTSPNTASTYTKITPGQAYDDPAFNPVAHMEPPGHKGGPAAEDDGGTERLSSDVNEADPDAGDEKGENLNYDWKGTDPNPEAGASPASGEQGEGADVKKGKGSK